MGAAPSRPLRRILVTGGTGFVGAHLVPMLRDAFPSATIVGFTGDIADPACVRQVVADAPPDACVHLAAISAIPAAQADPDLAWRVNLGGTLHLARALAEVPDCTLLFVSTADAYGLSFNRGAALDETAALNPMSIYGATKAAADLALGAMARNGLRVIRCRPFNHTGPGQSDAFVVASFARQVSKIARGSQAPELWVGALDPRRDFLDVRDVCRAYVACLERREQVPSGTVFNIASGVSRQIGDVLADLIRLARVDATVRTDPARLRASDIPVATGDAGLARRLLGWAPAIAWEQTLSDTLTYWRNAEAAAV